jgi:hypothetical protein
MQSRFDYICGRSVPTERLHALHPLSENVRRLNVAVRSQRFAAPCFSWEILRFLIRLSGFVHSMPQVQQLSDYRLSFVISFARLCRAASS